MKKVAVLLLVVFVLTSLISVQAGRKKNCDKFLENYSKMKNGGQSYVEYSNLNFQEAWMAMLQALSGSKYTLQTSSKEDGMLIAEYELTTHSRTCTIFVFKLDESIKISIKVVGKIKPGKFVGNVRDKNDICELFKSFEENIGS
jgi:hypothetical protein